MSPHDSIRVVQVEELAEVFGYNPDVQSVEELLALQQEFHISSNKDKRGNSQENEIINPYAEVSVDTARKAMGLYVFTCSVPLKLSDILRAKRKDPNRKN